MKVILWHSDVINEFFIEKMILRRIYGEEIDVIGSVIENAEYQQFVYQNKRLGTVIEKNDITKYIFDYIIVTDNIGRRGEIKNFLISLGVDERKIIPNTAILFPGFTIDRYNELRESNLTILSNDCFAGILYNSLGLPFMTPTINMWQAENDFLKFISKPQKYLDQELEYVGLESEPAPSQNVNYPVFKLDDIVLHMNHYGKLGPKIAKKKWDERKKRINWDNIFIFMKTEDEKALAEFDLIDYNKKICLTSERNSYHSSYYVPEEYIDGRPLWMIMNEIAKGILYKYDIWDLLLRGEKVEGKAIESHRYVERKKKIGFFGVVPITMFPSIMHRLGKYKNDDVTLIVDKDSYKKRDYIRYLENLKREKIFTEIMYCSLMIERKEYPKIKEEFISYVNSYFDAQMKDNKIFLFEFDEIVVFQDNWCADISLYFNYKKIPYKWMQFVPDNLIISKGNGYPYGIIRDEVKRYNAESAIAPFAEPVILDVSNKSISYLTECGKIYTLWSPSENLKSTKTETLEIILSCFESKDCLHPDISIFLFNSYGSGMAYSKIDESFDKRQKKILGWNDYGNDEIFSTFYSLLIDIYLSNSNEIFIKSHPNDPISTAKIKKLYGKDVQKFPEAPMEFVYEYFRRKKIKIGEMMGMASSALMNVGSDVCKKKWILKSDYFRTMHYYSSIYILAVLFQSRNIRRVYCGKYVFSQLENIIKKLDYNLEVLCYSFKELSSVIIEDNDAVIVDLKYRLCDVRFLHEIKGGILFLLNGRYQNDKYTREYLYDCVPIEIKKYPIKDGKRELQKDELIWVHTGDKNLRRGIRSFQFQKNFTHSGIRLFLKPHTLQEEVDLVDIQLNDGTMFASDEEKYNTLSCKVISVENIINKTITGTLNTFDERNISSVLKLFDDIDSYLYMLSILKKKYMIIFSVRDTPGSMLTRDIVNKIHGLGFSNFSTELWRMYIGIIDKGIIIYDQSGVTRENPIEIKFHNNHTGDNICVTSKAWRNGDISKILINGVDYSVNSRGINIVIYNSKTKNVIDSIGFDGHYENYKFTRKSLRNM